MSRRKRQPLPTVERTHEVVMREAEEMAAEAPPASPRLRDSLRLILNAAQAAVDRLAA